MHRLRLALLAAAAITLSGCAQVAGWYELRDLSATQVFLQGDVIIVGQEPLIAAAAPDGEGHVLRWIIGSSGAKFDSQQGISIDMMLKPERKAASPVPCITSREGDEVTCRLPARMPRGVYSYTVRIQDQSGRRLSSDPTFMF